MKRLVTTTVGLVAGMAALLAGTAFAGIYPVAPPGSSVMLQPCDFIEYVPLQSAGLSDPNHVIGDNIGQHPGGFDSGFPDVGTFFVGVFGCSIDTSNPGAAVYLWETSFPPNDSAFPGPQIELGYWDGAMFTEYGIPQTASYLGTGVPETGPDFGGREITSSITRLSDFGIFPGFAFELNAVRITAVDEFAHNQVTAVAINTAIPEPSSILLLGTGLVGMLACGCRGRRRAK